MGRLTFILSLCFFLFSGCSVQPPPEKPEDVPVEEKTTSIPAQSPTAEPALDSKTLSANFQTPSQQGEGDGGLLQAQKSKFTESRRGEASQKADQRIVNAVLGKEHVFTETTQSKATVIALQKLMEERRYDELETLAARYRQQRESLTCGTRKTVVLYYAIKTPRLNDRASWQSIRLLEWMEARPKSLLPKIGLARFLMEVDEGRWTSTGEITNAQLKLYMADPLKYSRKFLEEAVALGPDSDVYALLIDQVRRERGSLEEAERFLLAGREFDPTNYSLEGQYARLLHERGLDWVSGVVHEENFRNIESAYVRGAHRSPAQALDHALKAEAKYPKSTTVLNAVAKAAMEAGEFELAAQKFSQLGDRVEFYVWRPSEYYLQRNLLEKKGFKVDRDAFPSLPSRPPETKGLDIDRDLLELHLSELFSGEFYLELDAITNTFRERKSRFADGNSKMALVHHVLSTEALSDVDLAHRSVLFERWRTINPSSPTAATGSVSTAIDEAWESRGAAYARDVSEAQWAGFYERLNLAKKYLDLAVEQGAAKDAELYARAITLGMGLGMGKSEVRAYLKEAVAIDPDEPAPYQAMLLYLYPRWHGSPEEVEAFVESLSPELFARVATSALEELQMDRETAVQRIAEGYVGLARKTPNQVTWTRALWFSGAAKDRDLVKTCLQQLNGQWSPEWLPTQRGYLQFETFAQGGEL